MPRYRRSAQYRRPWGSQYGHAESAEEQRAPSMGCVRLVIVLFPGLGEWSLQSLVFSLKKCGQAAWDFGLRPQHSVEDGELETMLFGHGTVWTVRPRATVRKG